MLKLLWHNKKGRQFFWHTCVLIGEHTIIIQSPGTMATRKLETEQTSGKTESETCPGTENVVKPDSNDATMNGWHETLLKIPDLFDRLQTCLGSEDFKQLLKMTKYKITRRYEDKHNEKIHPTHFISLQITNKEIRDGIKKVQKGILENRSDLSSLMVDPASSHITLMVMHLTEDQIPIARETLDHIKTKIDSTTWFAEQLKIHGVGTFGGRVVFGKVESDNGSKQLDFMQDVVSKCYEKVGIYTTDTIRGFNPHMTIMKVPKDEEHTRVKKIPAACYKAFLEFYFGEQQIHELQLCAMSASKVEPGYYYVEHRISISNPATGGESPVNPEEVEKNLREKPKIDAYPFYGKECSFSSNHEAGFCINGLKFKSTEEWFMLCKALFHEQYDLALRVLGVVRLPGPSSPATLCGHLGPFHNGRKWEAVAKRVMTIGVAAKFTNHCRLAEELLETGDKVLVEASPDCSWGVGLEGTDSRILDKSLWRGVNWLGHILIVVRQGIRGGYLSVNADHSWKVTWNADGLPEVAEPIEFCSAFTWSEDNLPELMNLSSIG